MTTIRAYTTIEQSRKLAEILPLESADMYYCYGMDVHTKKWESDTTPTIIDADNQIDICDVPCWSLTALLNALPNDCGVNKEEDKFVASYLISDECGAYTSDNPIDACYEMILKLKELNLM